MEDSRRDLQDDHLNSLVPDVQVDRRGFVADMAKRNVRCAPVQDQGWGVLTQLTLPGGGKLSVYEPRHKRPGKPKGKTKK